MVGAGVLQALAPPGVLVGAADAGVVHPQQHGAGAWLRLGELVDRKAAGGMDDGGADAAHAGEAIRHLRRRIARPRGWHDAGDARGGRVRGLSSASARPRLSGADLGGRALAPGQLDEPDRRGHLPARCHAQPGHRRRRGGGAASARDPHRALRRCVARPHPCPRARHRRHPAPAGVAALRRRRLRRAAAPARRRAAAAPRRGSGRRSRSRRSASARCAGGGAAAALEPGQRRRLRHRSIRRSSSARRWPARR